MKPGWTECGSCRRASSFAIPARRLHMAALFHARRAGNSGFFRSEYIRSPLTHKERARKV